jgi:hypothetical protein
MTQKKRAKSVRAKLVLGMTQNGPKNYFFLFSIGRSSFNKILFFFEK